MDFELETVSVILFSLRAREPFVTAAENNMLSDLMFV